MDSSPNILSFIESVSSLRCLIQTKEDILKATRLASCLLMTRSVSTLVLLVMLASACQGPEPPVPGKPFGSGSRWQVYRFRSGTLPTTFPGREYPLLDALTREQFAWSVARSGRLVMSNAPGQRTVAAFVQRGDTLTLLFPGHTPLRLAVRHQGADSMTLQTLELPQTGLYLTQVTSLPTP